MSTLRRIGRIALMGMAILLVLAAGVATWYCLTIYPPSPPQDGYLALVDAAALVGEDLEPRDGTTVLIRDGTIVEVGSREDVDIPSGAAFVDLGGLTLMPGLMDLHVHLASPEAPYGEHPSAARLPQLLLDAMRYVPEKRRAFLEHGVTSVRDLGSEHRWIMKFRRLVRRGELEGPRLFAAGPMFTNSGGHPVVTIGIDTESDMVRLSATPAEARRAVREVAAPDARVDVVKIVQDRGRPGIAMKPIPLDVLHGIVDEAHEQGLPVTAHWGTQEDLRDLLAAGVDGLEHLEPRGAGGWPDELLDLMLERDVSITRP